jgi:hypothetical protein
MQRLKKTTIKQKGQKKVTSQHKMKHKKMTLQNRMVKNNVTREKSICAHVPLPKMLKV